MAKAKYNLWDGHWTLEHAKQRMTTKEWRAILLDERDHIMCRGQFRRLVAKNMGAGVVEVSKEPKEITDKAIAAERATKEVGEGA